MFKVIALIFLVGLCSARVPLRDPEHWDSWNNLDLLNRYMGGFNFGKNQLKSDSYLNELAQTVAEQDGNKNSFLRNYTKQNNGDNYVLFGITLRGNTTYEQILTQDYNCMISIL